MSTETQLHGDSLRRQLELSKNYAARNGLELVESIDGVPLRDIGVSGFRGRNAEQGVLGIFLEAVSTGKVERGSVLLIENLDRLSRDTVLKALKQFLSVLEAGVEIVTLADNHCYTYEGVNKDTSQILMSLLIMARANEESETKSRRLKAAWKNKRDHIADKPLTTKCPAWLAYSEDQGMFVEIPEKVQVVREIFAMCADTTGVWGIAKHLNEKKVPMFGRGTMWHRSYIIKILRNRAVLGEFQPGIREGGKQIPVGNPMPNYYPAIITEAEFLRAHAAIERRTKDSVGRKGASFSNIFSGLAYCGKCGAKMMLRNRGSTTKGGKWLVCSNQLNRVGCDMSEWRLEMVESLLIRHMREIDFESLIPEGSAAAKEIDKAIEAKQASLTKLQVVSENYLNTLGEQGVSPAIRKNILERISGVETDIEQERAELEKLLIERATFEDAASLGRARVLKETIEKLKASDGSEYLFRSSVHQLLAKAIERIEFVDPGYQFFPWEMTEESSEVKSFRASAKKREKLPLDELLDRPKFKEHCRDFSKRLVVRYRLGVARQIDVGTNITWIPELRLRKARLTSG